MPEQNSYRESTFSAGDGLRLYYRDYGDPLSTATPVLCLSGLTRNSKDFNSLAQRLSSNRRVVCLDYRGRGLSEHDSDWRNYDPPAMLGDIVHLLAVAGLHRIIVCGTSLGGLFAMGLGVAVPTVLAGVILNDIGPKVDTGGTDRILDYVSRDRPQPDWPAAIEHLQSVFTNLSFDTEKKWRQFAEATYRKGQDGLLHFDWDTDLVKPMLNNSNPENDFWPLFRALRSVPVLAIRGAVSDVLSQDTLQAMAFEKPDLLQVTVPDVGHAPALDEPLVERAIDDFVATIDRN